MNPLKNNKLMLALRLTPALLCAVFLLRFLLSGQPFSVELILDYTPENPALAAITLLVMYAAKSMSVVFPLILLQLAGGYLFSPPVAILVNLMGMLICISLPYWVGRSSGTGAVDKLLEKHPKLASIVERQQNNDFFLSFFLRVVGFLPGDLVSMYLGSINVSFGPYLIASMLGALPSVISITLMGASITDPTSPLFLISAVLTAALALSSILIYYMYQKRVRRDDLQHRGG